MAVPTDVNSPLNAPSHTGEHQRVSDLLVTAQNYPRGIVLWKTDWKSASTLAVPAGTETTLFNANSSFTLLSGRRYRIVCTPSKWTAAGNCFGWVCLMINGTRVFSAENYSSIITGGYATTRNENFMVGDGVSRAFNFVYWCQIAATVYMDGAAACYIEDVGV